MIGVIVFFVVLFIGYKLFNKRVNPYVKCHKKKWQSEQDYMDYLNWLSDSGGDLPIKEYKFEEDIEVLDKINRNFK